MVEEGHFINDEKEGIWNMWDQNGNVTKTERYSDGVLVE